MRSRRPSSWWARRRMRIRRWSAGREPQITSSRTTPTATSGSPRLSDADIVRTVDRTHTAIGRAGAVPARLVRPPYGASSTRVREVLAGAGYTQVLWTIDPRDWERTASAIRSGVLADVHDGGIVLLHDGVANSGETLAALPGLIDGIRSRGYCFGSLDAHGRGGASDPAGASRPAGAAWTVRRCAVDLDPRGQHHQDEGARRHPGLWCRPLLPRRSRVSGADGLLPDPRVRPPRRPPRRLPRRRAGLVARDLHRVRVRSRDHRGVSN
jgi:hypothetical protein